MNAYHICNQLIDVEHIGTGTKFCKGEALETDAELCYLIKQEICRNHFHSISQRKLHWINEQLQDRQERGFPKCTSIVESHPRDFQEAITVNPNWPFNNNHQDCSS